MKEYMVGFLVLITLVGLNVAQKNPPGQERLFEAHPTDCSAYYELQLHECPRGQLFNIEEQKCDSPGNVNCDCRGEGNACEKSAGEDEHHGNGDGDHGGHKGGNNGKGNKGGGSGEGNGHGKGGEKSNKDDKHHKHDDDDSHRGENHENDGKHGHRGDDDTKVGHEKHKGQHGSEKDGDDDDSQGQGKHDNHHGSKERGDDDDDESQEENGKGHGKDKNHHGSKKSGDDDDNDSQEGHGKDKNHHGSKERGDEDDDDSQEGHGKGHGKDKNHHGSKERGDEDDDDSQEGHGKEHGKGHGKNKKHHGSKERGDEDDDDSQEGHGKGHGKDKEHRGSKENGDEHDGDGHKGHPKGNHSGEDDSHENPGKSACKKLERSEHGKWIPLQCSKRSQRLGRVCRLECSQGFDRSDGYEVRCMESGWEGEYGVNIIPTCISGGVGGTTTSGDNEHSTESPATNTVEETGDEFINILNSTGGDFEQVLFIVDSSQNVGETAFYRTELSFVKLITEVLFSRISFFGLTTYNDVADVVIPLDEYQISGFIQRVDDVQYTPRDGSDLANVLEHSSSNIRLSRRRTLVVLISGTESSTDGSGEARLIQTQGNLIIPVMVGEVNRNTAISISSVNEDGSSLYFVFQSWESFSSTTVYISENYKTTSGDASSTQPTQGGTSGSETTSDTTASTAPTTEDTSGDVQEISDQFLNILNYTGYTDESYEQVLFIVDSSQNVGEATFYHTELYFVKVITDVLFSRISFFGLTAYSDVADVVIPLAEYGSSGFIQRVDDVQYSLRDGSDMANVLNRSFSDIRSSGRRTLVLLISGTESSTDGSGEARLIQSRGNTIIPVVVGEGNRNTATSVSSTNEEGSSLYFLFQSWESFSSTTTYISQHFTSGSTHATPSTDETPGIETTSPGTPSTNTPTTEEISGHETTSPDTPSTSSTTTEVISACDALENIENGHWESSTCSEEASTVGTVCQLVCASGYDLSGDSEVTCTGNGWESSDGDNQLPACMTLEERSSELVERLNNSLQGTPNILIVLDESSSVGQDQFTNIQLAFFKNMLKFISLSTHSIGVITYSDTANVVIPLGEYQRSELQERMNSISYEQGGVSNIENALEVVTSEMQRSEVSGSTLILLVSASESSTDGSSQARLINNNGGVIFPLVVGSDYNRLLYISSVTEREERTFFKFTSWESFSSILSFISENYQPTEEPTTTASPDETQSAAESGEEVVSVLNGTFTGFEQVLFIVDSSRNVGESTFYNTELSFVKAVTEVAFSRISYFGLITYNDYAEVVIPFTEIESAEFIQRVDSVQYSPRDGSDIANVLDRAFSVIRQSGWRTLVVFISGTESSIDGSDEARLMKSRGHYIIPLFVGEVNRETAISISSTNEEGNSVYFLFQSWEIFNATTTYIRQTYISDSPGEVQVVCEALENSQRGHWEASNCSTGTSELGTVCELVCEEGYELSGTPEVSCNQSGWVSYGGGSNLPSCKTIEEIGEDFIADISRNLGRPANLMFVVDGSGSLTEEEFGLEKGLVNAIVRAFPLSEDRSAGVVTFSSGATVDVSVSSDDTCTFLSDLSAIRYPRGGTNLAQALQLANNELEQNAVHDFTVTILITDGISTTDPTESAAVLKQGGNPLFAIGVGDYDAEQLMSIATYFYPIRDFGIFNSLKNVLENEYANRTNVQC